MKGNLKGAIAVFIIFSLVVVGFFFGKPIWDDFRQQKTSDARETKGKIKIAFDNWAGYVPLCSSEMKKRMRGSGWVLECQDDKADYTKRMERLYKGEIEFAVATVDSYILNAASLDFPGVIGAVIDKSKGGDAILAWQDKVSSLDALKGRTDIRVAFTPNSPSHHLGKAAVAHFDVPELLPKGDKRIETNGSEEALKKLLDRKADVAILWEPDVSKALAKKGIIKLLGTDQTERLIVDILVVNRKFSEKNSGVVKMLLETYFKVLKMYRDEPELLKKEIMAQSGLSANAVDSLLKGIHWATLTENAQEWFGISSDGGYADQGLVDTIDSTVRILMQSGDFAKNPIPQGDPYRLTEKEYIKELFTKGFAGFTTPGAKNTGQSSPANSLEARFALLGEDGWNALREIGTLKIQPVTFQSGTADMGIQGKEEIDRVAETLKHYPNFRVVIKGHTSIEGDPVMNRNLSQERAESVARYLVVTYSVDANRLHAVGLGSERPLPRQPGESSRTYSYRLPRVEISLVSEVY